MKTKVKRRRIKRSKNPSPKLYFGLEEHEAIITFQGTEKLSEKEEIYITKILPAFNKLAENLIFIHGFAKQHGGSYEDLRNDCVTFLYETLHKFDHTRGTKAFSYFNVVAKNWLIIQSKKRTKLNKRQVSLEDILSLSENDIQNVQTYSIVPAQDQKLIKEQAIADLFKMMEKIKARLNGENELACINAIITLFKKIDDLELLNKRAIFVYLRDLSNLNPKKLSVAMSIIRKHYKDLSKSGEYDIFF
tara:strand:+ start:2891 stop:3631 length:741 start_codon:yes stop_codon:yes gene_type:complete